jgi:hypothetical protein
MRAMAAVVVDQALLQVGGMAVAEVIRRRKTLQNVGA